MRRFDERQAWERLGRIAGQQYGVVTTQQLLAHFHRRQAQGRVQRGLLVRSAVGVWRLPTYPPSWEQQVMTCTLAGGPRAVASHISAGAIWGLEGVTIGAVHVTVPRSRSDAWSRRGPYGPYPLVVHRPAVAMSSFVRVNRFAVTSAARTLVDLAGHLEVSALERATDDALRRGVVSLRQLKVERDRWPRPGASRLDPIIGLRSESGVGESVWEDRVWDWIVSAGLPAPVRQFEVRLARRVVRLDLAYPPLMIAIEFDGYASHGARQQFDRDRVRVSELAAAGWAVLIVTSKQTQEFVVDLVRQALVNKGWESRA